MKRYWQMRVLNKAEKRGEILLYGLIGESFWGGDGTTAKQFVKDLKDMGDITALDIRINSPGGLVSDGLAMYNNLKAHKAVKTVYVDGEASSIASVIAMAGDKIVMPENSWMMIHDPLTFAMGNAAELRKTADVLDKMRDGIITAYRTKTPLAEDEIKALMSAETWMLGAEAKEKGFCTECVEDLKAVALSTIDRTKFRNTPPAVLAAAEEKPKNPDCMMSAAPDDPEEQTMEPMKPCKECGAMDGCNNPKKQTDSSAKDASTTVPAGSGPDGTTRESGPVAAKTAQPSDGGSRRLQPAQNDRKEKEIIMKKCTVCGHDHAEGVTCPVCAERARMSAIVALGQKYGMLAEANAAVAAGKTEAAFQKEVLDKMDTGAVIVPGIEGAKVSPASGDKPFRNFGEQLVVVRAHALSGGRTAPDKRLLQIVDAASGGSESVDSDAGFLVQQDFAGFLNKEMMENSNLISRCFNVPIGQGSNGLWLTMVKETTRATGSRWGGVQVYRVAEAEAATSKKPKLEKKYMELEKMMGLCYATEESMQDTTALGALYQRAFGEEFGFKCDDEIINGTGAGQMQGILESPALVSIDKETGQAAATIEADNIIKMYAAATPKTKMNGVWLVNSEVWQQLPKLNLTTGTSGALLFMPPGGLTQSPYGTLLGRPIIEVEQCAALGTVGDIIFADLGQYLTISKGGLNAQSSIHVKFTTDETTFKFTMRNNGMTLWQSALTPYKGSQTRSPFVALATRS